MKNIKKKILIYTKKYYHFLLNQISIFIKNFFMKNKELIKQFEKDGILTLKKILNSNEIKKLKKNLKYFE